jgi:hypothetical protein
VLGDPRRELDPLAFEVLDNRLEWRFGLEGYDGTTSGLRPLGLPLPLSPLASISAQGPSCSITEKPKTFW